MPRDESIDSLTQLLHELRSLPRETEWAEFKYNNADPDEIGEYISALANAAALYGKAHAYVVWGVDDATHEVIGTEFRAGSCKVGNEELENWLLRLLQPRINFRFNDFPVDGKRVCLLEIQHAVQRPVQFKGIEYIRVGSYKKKLKDHPERERTLWRVFDVTPFEQQIAAENLNANDVLQLLDYPSYFKLLDRPMPESHDAVLACLADDHMVAGSRGSRWNVLNLGAVLFATNLSRFDHLGRKALRVVEYDGAGRIRTKREYQGHMGYAAGFEGAIAFLKGMLPANEIIGDALRRSVPMYPEPAIRELIANVVIHQDFTLTGTGPMVEVFDARLEITNPGEPLMDTLRFLDTPPRSRNEALASFLRRAGICEERGSGIDKVVFQTELYQLPAPLFEVVQNHTRAVLFAHKPFAAMDKDDRVRACYLHACLQHVQRKQMTNTTLRKRFGIEEQNRAQVSRVISDTVDARLVRPYNPESGSRRHASYVPWWA